MFQRTDIHSMPANDNEPRASNSDLTVPINLVEGHQLQQEQPKQKRPPREISQASIASFFYGTLQLLTTSIGAAILIPLMGLLKAFETAAPTDDPNAATPSVPATGVDLAEMQKMIEELGITDSSGVTPVIPQPAITTPDVATTPGTIPGMPTLPRLSSPEQIVPFEILAILLMNSFGFMGIMTAIVTFRAVSKGKSGLGLAVTGLMSSLISFGIAFYAAYII